MADKLSIVIPAAGMGRRMKSYGPKSLLDLGNGQTVLGRQLEILRRVHPRADVVLVVGYLADKVAQAATPDVRIVENENYYDTGVARSIELGIRACATGRVLVVYGDLVFNEEAVDGFDLRRSSVLVDSRQGVREYEVGTNIVDGAVTTFSYGLPVRWAHIAYLTGRELALFQNSFVVRERRRYFGYEILNEVVDRGGRLTAQEPEGLEVVEIDTTADLSEARRMV